MPPTDPSLRAWWPTTQSLDLIKAPIEDAAAAVDAELTRILNNSALSRNWREVRSLDQVFSGAPTFTNVPTYFALLSSRSPWTVMWNNSFLCDGYSSLCWCITAHQGLPTLHWSSHDDWTTFQSGSIFQHCRKDGDEVAKRHVQAAQEDSRWTFFQSGEPLPEEDVPGYEARKKSDRLNETRVMELLNRLGARPWREDFYDLPGRIFVMERLDMPSTISRRSRDDVLKAPP